LCCEDLLKDSSEVSEAGPQRNTGLLSILKARNRVYSALVKGEKSTVYSCKVNMFLRTAFVTRKQLGQCTSFVSNQIKEQETP
jgi:hypothetical protein